jgi:hypothetical protein
MRCDRQYPMNDQLLGERRNTLKWWLRLRIVCNVAALPSPPPSCAFHTIGQPHCGSKRRCAISSPRGRVMMCIHAYLCRGKCISISIENIYSNVGTSQSIPSSDCDNDDAEMVPAWTHRRPLSSPWSARAPCCTSSTARAVDTPPARPRCTATRPTHHRCHHQQILSRCPRSARRRRRRPAPLLPPPILHCRGADAWPPLAPRAAAGCYPRLPRTPEPPPLRPVRAAFLSRWQCIDTCAYLPHPLRSSPSHLTGRPCSSTPPHTHPTRAAAAT